MVLTAADGCQLLHNDCLFLSESGTLYTVFAGIFNASVCFRKVWSYAKRKFYTDLLDRNINQSVRYDNEFSTDVYGNSRHNDRWGLYAFLMVTIYYGYIYLYACHHQRTHAYYWRNLFGRIYAVLIINGSFNGLL